MKAKKRTELYEWQKRCKEGGVCAKCKEHRDYLTVDHIIPVSIVKMLDVTGEAVYGDEENFQTLCSPCNAFKSNNLERENKKTKELLIKYLN